MHLWLGCRSCHCRLSHSGSGSNVQMPNSFFVEKTRLARTHCPTLLLRSRYRRRLVLCSHQKRTDMLHHSPYSACFSLCNPTFNAPGAAETSTRRPVVKIGWSVCASTHMYPLLFRLHTYSNHFYRKSFKNVWYHSALPYISSNGQRIVGGASYPETQKLETLRSSRPFRVKSHFLLSSPA
jgi:hypothetical protein